MSAVETHPQVFISYSWTTPDHEAWVLQLATDLRENGVDAILDKWDLKEGHDGYKFMERMVNDDEIRKVILICDEGYVSKADSREGGVGTETQIITPEIYNNNSQDKFVAIVKERDDQGNPYLPTFFRSRIFIDFSDPVKQSKNFEQLMRWIFDKQLHKKPQIGSIPPFLREEDSVVTLATSSRCRRAVSAIVNNLDHKFVLVEEFFQALSSECEKLRIQTETVETFDDLVVESIESFLPYRNEVIQICLLLARYPNANETAKVIHRFMEGLIPYMKRSENIMSSHDWDFDNFKFIIHELYLYAVACFIRHERFETAASLMGTGYYLPPDSVDYRANMKSFEVFCNPLESLWHRKQRLKLNRASLHADLLRQRSNQSGISFRYLMQADFVLYLRSLHLVSENRYRLWKPETLLFSCNYPRVFEIFVRSQSAAYFNQVKVLLSVEDKSELGSTLAKLKDDTRLIPSWTYYEISPNELLGYDKICTAP